MSEPRQLTELETKVLQAVIAQGSYRLTPSTLAEMCGCSLTELFTVLQSDDFYPLWTSALQRTTAIAVPEILNAFEQEAIGGSFKHGKLLLEIAGLYTQKTQTEFKGSIRVDDPPFASDEERREFLAKMLSRYESGGKVER